MGVRFNVGQLDVDVKLEQTASDFDGKKYGSITVTDWEGKLQNRNGKPPPVKHSTPSVTVYKGFHRRKGPNFGRVFLMLNYTDITQNTYVPS